MSHHLFRSLCASALLSVLGGSMLAPVALAKPTLTDEQKQLVTDFVKANLAEGPQYEFIAKLDPPITSFTFEMDELYRTSLVAGRQKLDKELKKTGITDIGGFGTTVENTFVWKHDISCGVWHGGEWGTGDKTWSHPNGKNVGECPHPNATTNHPGTIGLSGHLDYKIFGTVNGEVVDLFHGVWTVNCSYSGSESGKEKCTNKSFAFNGTFDDQGKKADFSQPEGLSSETPPLDYRTAAAGVAAIGLAAGAAYWIRARLIGGDYGRSTNQRKK